MKINKKINFLLVLSLMTLPLQARWFWYEPAPVVVYREPAASAADVIVGGIVGIGCGIAALVNFKSKKRKIKEYEQTFKDMGYDAGRSKIYAKMAVEHTNGLQGVINSIDKDKQNQSQLLLQNNMLEQAHSQKMQEMSHQQKLQLMNYLVMMLSMVILIGFGFFLYRRKQ